MSISPAPVSVHSSQSYRPPPTQTPAPFVTRFVTFWWIRIPLRIRRYSTLLAKAWSDGVYLTSWPRVATILVLGVALFGFAEGATHWSLRTIVGTNGFSGNVLAPMATANNWGGPTHLIFADNLLLLIVAVAFGTISANLGITLVLSYAIGDFFSGPLPLGPGWRAVDAFNAWIYLHVPLLTSYIVFFALASLPVLMAMDLAESAHQRIARSTTLIIALTAVIEAAVIYCWGTIAPMMFRTVQLWSGGVPRMTVPYYRHIAVTWLVPVAIAAVLLRALLLTLATRNRSVPSQSWRVTRGTTRQIPQWVRSIILAGVITLLMMGFLHNPSIGGSAGLTNYGEAELVFLGLAAALLARSYWLPHLSGWQRWSYRVEQYPPVLRLIAATVASYLLCLVLIAIPGLQSKQAGEFGPEVTALLVGVGLTLVLLPQGWAGRPVSRWVAPWRSIPVPSPVGQAGIIAVLVMITSKKAYADCYDFACCMANAVGTAAAAAAAGIPILGGVAGAAATGAAHGAEAGAASSDAVKWSRVKGSPFPEPPHGPTIGPQMPGTTVPDDGPPVYDGWNHGGGFWHNVGQIDQHIRDVLGWYQDHGSEWDVPDYPEPGSNNAKPTAGSAGAVK